MPRIARALRAGFVYHVLNRGRRRSDIFHKADGFALRSESLCGQHCSAQSGLGVVQLETDGSKWLGWTAFDGPILKPTQWTRYANAFETEAELKAIRHSLARVDR